MTIASVLDVILQERTVQSDHQIAALLTASRIPNPCGGREWSESDVEAVAGPRTQAQTFRKGRTWERR